MMQGMLDSGMGYTTVNAGYSPPSYGLQGSLQTGGISGNIGTMGVTGAGALIVLLGGLFILYWATRNIQGL